MRERLYKLASWFTRWHQRHLASIDIIHITAVVVGLFCGIGAGLLKLGVGYVTSFVFSNIDVDRMNFMFFLLPIAGIFLATVFATYIIKEPMDHASERIAAGMASGKNDIPPKLIWAPIVGCSLTLGMGGSAGAEDPITYTGAAVGSNIGKMFRVPPDILGDMVGCGAAAAIAGIFMAPIGGVMFALEVLRMKQSLRTVLAIVIASLTAGLSCYIMLGCHTDITFVPEMRFDLSLIPYVLLLAVVCGMYSVYYSRMMTHCRRGFAWFSNRWAKALTGSVILGLLLWLFPSLYGEGYNTVHHLMENEPMSVLAFSPVYGLGLNVYWLVALVAAVLLVKPIATSATNDSGGIGGDFTPTFFCGGVLGFLFALVANHFLGLQLPVAIFAFFGMSAVMAGAIHAPLMAIFITAEMTGLYGFILPLTLAAIVSYMTTVVFGNRRLHLPEWLQPRQESEVNGHAH